MPHDEPQHVSSLRAEREADCQLARALRHRVGDDAVDADDREQERDAREDGDEVGRVAAHEGGARVVDDLLHRPHAEDGHFRVELAHEAAHRARHCRRLGVRARDEAHARVRPLRDGEVDDGRGARVEARHLLVADDADDLEGRLVRGELEGHAPAQGVFAVEDARGERLVDDDDGRRVCAVAVVEVSALEERHAHYAEVARAHSAQVRLGPRGGRLRQAEDARRARASVAAQGQVAHLRRAAHARQRRRATQQLVVEGGGLHGVCRARGRKLEGHRQEVLSPEAGVDREHAREALHQQPRAHEEHERERDLGDDEQVAHAARATRAGAARALLHRLLQVGARGRERGREAEDDAGQKRQAEGEEEYVRVERELTQVGHARELRRGYQRDEQVGAPQREHEPRAAAHEREQHALRQKLTHHAPARSAERRPQRDLFAPRRRAREQEVGDVGAGDQKHEADRAQEREEDGPKLPDELLLQRHDADAGARVRLRVVRRDARGDRLHLRARRLKARARLQTRDDLNPVPVARAGLLRADLQRRPQLGVAEAREAEARGQDADYRATAAARRDRLADDTLVAAVAPLPELVAQQHDAGAARRFVALDEGSPAQRGHAERVEEVRADRRALHALRAFAAREREEGRREAGDRLELRALAPPVEEVRVGSLAPVELFLRVRLPEVDEPRRVFEGQRPQERRVHDREDGAVGADAQRQRHDRDQSEARLLQQHAHRVSHVLKKSPHLFTSVLSRESEVWSPESKASGFDSRLQTPDS